MTAQIPDQIRIYGEWHSLFGTPLDPLLSQNSESTLFESQTTANWRGYVASWEIVGEHLYLVSVSADSQSGVIHSRTSGGNKVLEHVLHAREEPVLADWYTGTLQIPQGDELEYVHGGFLSLFERDVFIEIQRGRVVRRWEVDNRPAHAAAQVREEREQKSLLAMLPKLSDDTVEEARSLLREPLRAARSDPPISRREIQNSFIGNALRYALFMLLRRLFDQPIVGRAVLSDEDRAARSAFQVAEAAIYDAAVAVWEIESLLDGFGRQSESSNRPESIGDLRLSLDGQRTATALAERVGLPEGDEQRFSWAEEIIKEAEGLLDARAFERIGVALAIIEEEARKLD